jgi:hypothetical protein
MANGQSWLYRNSAYEIVMSEVLRYVDKTIAPVAFDEIESTFDNFRFVDFEELPLGEQQHVAKAARRAAETIASNLGNHLKEDPEIVKTYVRITQELADQMAESVLWSEAQASNPG